MACTVIIAAVLMANKAGTHSIESRSWFNTHKQQVVGIPKVNNTLRIVLVR